MTPPATCTRTTRRHRPCRGLAASWPQAAPLVNPRSCFQHLTPEEHAVLERVLADREATQARLLAGYPACWAWSPDDIPEAAPDPVEAAIAAALPCPVRGPEYAAHMALLDWHGGRCALCGHRRDLVEDHDHRTGLVRGYLCQSCNVLEGTHPNGAPLFDRYRERPPAAILGVSVRYFHPITGEYAQPQPDRDDADAWTDAASEGIGL